ncbi:MAG: cytochrome c peroxidase [Chloroherpetonaceae bacterium]|nr:c-type cytochrome [Chloroherpetonaceae bacterium]MCS7210658.1 c-type cytochrome [Chloroherpetonaceae bacterium]MDW8020923.1 cytochrome c peroxidase [Chloroherpetonaceae bacterium]
MNRILTFVAIAIIVVASSCTKLPKTSSTASKDIADSTVKATFSKNLRALHAALGALDSLIASAASDTLSKTVVQQAFRTARLAYKRIEFLSEYYAPRTSEEMNGPALVKVGEEFKLEQPTGFQVLEEMLFPDVNLAERDAMLRQVKIMRSLCKRFDDVIIKKTLSDTRIFDAMRLEIARIITLGITGFDSPIAQHSIPEAQAAVEGLAEAFECYAAVLVQKDTAKLQEVRKCFRAAISYLASHAQDFNAFNRLHFIVEFANPLSEALYDVQVLLQIPFLETKRPFRTTAKTLFDPEAFDPTAYAPDYMDSLNLQQVALGKLLFFEPLLSENNQRSCASCHQPEHAFTDGLPRALTIARETHKLRNTPTLINSAFQASSSYDQKTIYLEDRVRFVVHSPDEMKSSLDAAAAKLAKSAEYQALFRAAFGVDNAVTGQHIAQAIASYMRSLIALNSRFDQYMRGDKTKMSESEQRGFNLFAGKAKCATCHFIPFFNGTVPPDFTETEAEVIGVPKEAKWKNAEIDPDIGKMATNGIELNRYMFKTPTLRNVALTAPYMHNGVYKTLDEVMRFYNVGGGKGIGIDLDHQTLPEDKLNLTKQEIQDIIAFMKALTDTTGLTARPTALPRFNDDMLNARKVGGSY